MDSHSIVDIASKEGLDLVWGKATIVSGYDERLFRKDAAGAWIARNAYGNRNSIFGWEVDHIYPSTLGGGNHYGNLRPMQWRNNISKGNDYPIYMAVVCAEEGRNINAQVSCTVNESIQRIINLLYHVD